MDQDQEYAASPQRYSKITEKNPREIVMLRGNGCAWRRCRFCDYHLDASLDQAANYALNRQVLSKVTGVYQRLEVINSGSFFELDADTQHLIEDVCLRRGISTLHFESHWMYRTQTEAIRRHFQAKGITVKIKTGVETFDSLFRECYLNKGIDTDDPAKLACYFDEVCLLQGIPGQTRESMERDIQTGLAHFERVCVNIMTQNSCPIQPDKGVIRIFLEELYPKYKDDPRMDLLLHNTDFGVGGNIDA